MKTQCDICEEIVPSKDFESHRGLHDPSDRVVCRGCGRESLNPQQHREHTQNCFNCPLCRRNYSGKKCLLEHECADLDESFLCACGQNFCHFKDIIKHAKGPMILHCCSCDNTSTSFTNHANHIRDHTQSCECPVCGEVFQSVDDYKTHRKRKHRTKNSNEELHACEDCGKQFKASRIEAHRRKHKRSSCLCPECGKRNFNGQSKIQRNSWKFFVVT